MPITSKKQSSSALNDTKPINIILPGKYFKPVSTGMTDIPMRKKKSFYTPNDPEIITSSPHHGIRLTELASTPTTSPQAVTVECMKPGCANVVSVAPFRATVEEVDVNVACCECYVRGILLAAAYR
jgi:hypothetical protein